MIDLITLNEYKEQEGITSPKDDLRLNHVIPSVSQLVKTYCGNSIVDYANTNKVEEFTLDWATSLVQLTESPLIEVVQVEERENFSSPYTALTEQDYYVNSVTDSIIRVSGSSYKNWKTGPGAVRITYKAGYEECPADLKLAMYDLVTYYLKDEHKERRSLQGATIQNQASTSQRNNVAFPDHIKRVLDLYKNF
jgi:hypothetical protein